MTQERRVDWLRLDGWRYLGKVNGRVLLGRDGLRVTVDLTGKVTNSSYC